jgi:hypothetical protein
MRYNTEIYDLYKDMKVTAFIKCRQLQWAGCIMGMVEHCIANHVNTFFTVLKVEDGCILLSRQKQFGLQFSCSGTSKFSSYLQSAMLRFFGISSGSSFLCMYNTFKCAVNFSTWCLLHSSV